MGDPISVTISVLGLFTSVPTAWLTPFRRGTVKMTQPTAIYFGPDTPRTRDEPPYQQFSCERRHWEPERSGVLTFSHISTASSNRLNPANSL